MKTTKTFIVLLIGLLWIVPDAFAVFRDDSQSSEEPSMIQDMIHKNTYRKMVEERKRKSKEAASRREKRKATLTPFVYNIPQESLDRGPREQSKLKKKASNNSPPVVVEKRNMRGEIEANMFANILIIAAIFSGMILILKYLRPKE